MNEAKNLLDSEYLQCIERGEGISDGCNMAGFIASGWISSAEGRWMLTSAGRQRLHALLEVKGDNNRAIQTDSASPTQ